MLINFITDSEVQQPGFLARYLAIPKSKGNPDERMKVWFVLPTRLYSSAAYLYFYFYLFFIVFFFQLSNVAAL